MSVQKGFPDETPTLQKELEAYFNKFGTASAVRMRRDEAKKFKVCIPSRPTRTNLTSFQSSVFVEFADFKSVDAFLNADPKPSWNGTDLLVMTK